MSYQTELLNKHYVENVVIQILGQYFSIRQPDSGLVIPVGNLGVVANLQLNPATVDLIRVNTTTESYSFDLNDLNQVITSLFGNIRTIVNTPVSIWIGRIGVGMDFSQYFQMPISYLQTIAFSSRTYAVTTVQNTVMLNREIFSLSSKLTAPAGTSDDTLTIVDISKFPATGLLYVDKEFISYSGVDTVHNQFTGCVRAQKNTVAAAHSIGADTANVIAIQDNPLNLLLQLLISKGGGGPFDVLSDGAGLLSSTIDVTEITALRDSNFGGQTYSFLMYNIGTAIDFIQNEILLPCNLRFRTSAESLLSVCLLNQSVFGVNTPLVDETSTTDEPTWTLDSTKCVNQISVQWDWDDATQTYLQLSNYSDTTSIAALGPLAPLNLAFKGVKAALGGQAVLDLMASRQLDRFSTPLVQIDLKTQLITSLSNVGDKILVVSTRIPGVAGGLNFAAIVEITERSISHTDGTVDFVTMFTSYTGLRIGYIAPADFIVSHTDQSNFNVTPGNGSSWVVGETLMLWDMQNLVFTSDPPNQILNISGDTLSMESAWTTPILDGRHMIRFADYDHTGVNEHLYAFVGYPLNGKFNDGTGAYQITV